MQSSPLRLLTLLCLSAALVITPAGFDPQGGMVWAQDDDGGDDDDDGGGGATGADDDSGPTVIRRNDGGPKAPVVRKARKPAPAPARRVPVKPQPLAQFAPEIVTIGLSGPDLATLLDTGFSVIEQQALPGAGVDLLRLAPPTGVALADARDIVRGLPSGTAADFNHYYRSNQDVIPASGIPAPVSVPDVPCLHDNCGAHGLIEWPDAAVRGQCGTVPTIGVIDTGVNPAHEVLQGAKVDLVMMTPDDADPSGQVHGTAVLSVLAGDPATRVGGLLPDAQFVVADVFARQGGDERADVASLIRGLDLMDRRGVRVVNLSLAGPANVALETVVRRLVDDRQMVLVAAVGNGGAKQAVAHPAAYAGVIGVTAVDRRGRLYPSAQQGPEVDLAAPGVGLMLATSIRGAREKTGTSFAAPFVTAAAALVLARDATLGPVQVAALLSDAARDLGAAGKDDGFGAGLVQAGALCR